MTSPSHKSKRQSRSTRQVREGAEPRTDTLSGPRVSWCQYYELPFEEHLAKVLFAVGLFKPLQLALAGGAVTSDFIRLLPEMLESELPPDAKLPDATDAALAMALVTSLMKSFECKLAYGVWLNQLVWCPRNNWTTHFFAFLRRGSVQPG